MTGVVPQELPLPSVHAVFEAQVQKTPNALAVSMATESLSYEELNSRANRLADYLLRTGVESGGLVGVYQSRSLELFVSLLGIMKAGAAYVMLDPAQPVERLQQICQAAELSSVLSSEALKDQLTGITARLITLDSAESVQALSASAQTNLSLALTGESAAFAYFTSGSRECPKGH